MKCSRFWVWTYGIIRLTGLCVGFFLCTSLTHAYDKDTHYALTYYAARAVGYTQEQAFRIASADQSIDDNPMTEPVQGQDQGRAPSAETLKLRTLYHAMIDLEKFPFAMTLPLVTELDRAVADVDSNSIALEAICTKNGNIGPWLHFHQDSYAHAGYGNWWGHVDVAAVVLRNSYGKFLKQGHTTDYLSFKPKQFGPHDWDELYPEVGLNSTAVSTFYMATKKKRAESRNEDMLASTIASLKRFAAGKTIGHELSLAESRCSDLLIGLQKANPLDEDSSVFVSSPNYVNACNVVDSALKADGELTPFKRLNRQFNWNLNADRTFASTISVMGFEFSMPMTPETDRFVLWGDVTIKFPIDWQTREWDVTLRLLPTRANEDAVVVYQNTIPRGQFDVTAHGCPVGEYELVANLKGTLTTVQRFSVLGSKTEISVSGAHSFFVDHANHRLVASVAVPKVLTFESWLNCAHQDQAQDPNDIKFSDLDERQNLEKVKTEQLQKFAEFSAKAKQEIIDNLTLTVGDSQIPVTVTVPKIESDSTPLHIEAALQEDKFGEINGPVIVHVKCPLWPECDEDISLGSLSTVKMLMTDTQKGPSVFEDLQYSLTLKFAIHDDIDWKLAPSYTSTVTGPDRIYFGDAWIEARPCYSKVHIESVAIGPPIGYHPLDGTAGMDFSICGRTDEPRLAVLDGQLKLNCAEIDWPLLFQYNSDAQRTISLWVVCPLPEVQMGIGPSFLIEPGENETTLESSKISRKVTWTPGNTPFKQRLSGPHLGSGFGLLMGQ